MADVAVYPATYDTAADAVRRAFENFCPPIAGRRVLIKPNLLTGAAPERATTTHPAVVAAALAECLARGAAEVLVGDNPGVTGYGAARRVAAECGILDVADGHFVNLGEAVRPVAGASPWVEPLPFSAVALDADVLISLPKAKTHACTTITGAVKNHYGLVPGSVKMSLHRLAVGTAAFAGAVVDVYQVRPPDLVITDAVMAMEGNGPHGGSPRRAGVLLAGRNGVEVDAAMAFLFAMVPESIPTLAIAAARGLGRIDLLQLRIAGELTPIRGFKAPAVPRAVGNLAMRLFTSLWVGQPVPIEARCVRCGACAAHCPVRCIRMTPLPVIDERRCVNCFCCHEFCKYQAMRIEKRLRIGGHKIRWQ